jgi:predicted O-methyltransferase YrrM
VDKEHYPRVRDRAAAALRPGGLLISDNMLWFGTVLERDAEHASTRGVQELTRLLYGSDEFDTVLIPLRDGVTVSLYRG